MMEITKKHIFLKSIYLSLYSEFKESTKLFCYMSTTYIVYNNIINKEVSSMGTL